MSASSSALGSALLRQVSRFATSGTASSSSPLTSGSSNVAAYSRLSLLCNGTSLLAGQAVPSSCSSAPLAPSLLRSYAQLASNKAAGAAAIAAARSVEATAAVNAVRSTAAAAAGASAVASRAVPAGLGLQGGLSQRGMLSALGVLSRRAAAAAGPAATTAGSAAAGATGLRSFAGLAAAGLRVGTRHRGALMAPLRRFRSTTAAAAEGAASSAAAESGAAAAATGAVQATRRLYGGAALSEGLSNGARLAIAGWLAVSSVWVYSMVVLGGITRLTRSGLSMTEWKLAGERPPLSEQDWGAEFTKYQASPEYQKVHRGMTLEEFKFIYWMEYAHRMWGRFLGLAFALPAAAFLARGWVRPALGRRLALLFFMGGTQGLVGWWMVRSGLEEPEHEWAAPRVSPYRLAAHLVSAFAIYATLVWTSLDLLYPRPATSAAPAPLLAATSAARSRLLPLAALIAVTATSGAFVAGLDAGRAYNTWPLMGGRVVPEEYWDERLGLSPAQNLFENTAAVQFNHRTLAITTLLAVGTAWLRYSGGQLPRRATSCLHAVAAITAAQFALGVYTLLQYVPVHLGSAHQANALNLFTAALALLHATRPPAPSPAAAAAAPLVTPAAAALVGCVGYLVATQNGTLTQSEAYRGPAVAPAAVGVAAAGAGGK